MVEKILCSHLLAGLRPRLAACEAATPRVPRLLLAVAGGRLVGGVGCAEDIMPGIPGGKPYPAPPPIPPYRPEDMPYNAAKSKV